MTMIRQARLLLLSRVLSKKPPLIMELALCIPTIASSWVAGVQSDFKWLAVDDFFRHGVGFSFAQRVDFFSSDPASCSRAAKRFCKTPWANLMVQNDKCVVSGLDRTFLCSLCEQRFDSAQKLSLHRFKSHGCKGPHSSVH